MSDNNITSMPVMSYPELGRLHAELEDVIDKYRGAGIPHASVLGVLVLLMDEVSSDFKRG